MKPLFSQAAPSAALTTNRAGIQSPKYELIHFIQHMKINRDCQH